MVKSGRIKMGTGMIPVPRGDASTLIRKEGERGERGKGSSECSRGDCTESQKIAGEATIVRELNPPSRLKASTVQFGKGFVHWICEWLAIQKIYHRKLHSLRPLQMLFGVRLEQRYAQNHGELTDRT